MTERPTCATCRWWEPADASSTKGMSGFRACRRYPPKAPLGERFGEFPLTYGDIGCGEHTPRETDTQEETPCEP